MVEVGRDLWGSPSPSPWSSGATKGQLPRTVQTPFEYLGNLFQHSGTLDSKKVFPNVLLQLINMVSRHFEKYFDFGVETFFHHLTHTK